MFNIDELKYFPVNWTDGMRVGSKDFIATDNAWSDALRDLRVTMLQGTRFGLLPPIRDNSDTSNYPKFLYDSGRGVLTLIECRAITSGGYRVEITQDLFRDEKVPTELPNARISAREDFDVYITVDMFKKQAAGNMSADAPPRRSVLCPIYELSVLPRSAGVGLSGENHLKIAEFKWDGGKLMQDIGFLPPCLTISSHPELIKLHIKAGANMKIIHDNLVSTVYQYRNDQRPNVRNATEWMERMVIYLSSNLWTYNEELSGDHPLRTIIFFKNWMQFVISISDMYKENPFLENGYKTQLPAFKKVASPSLNAEELQKAFDTFRDASESLHRWWKAVVESFKVNRVVRVDEIR